MDNLRVITGIKVSNYTWGSLVVLTQLNNYTIILHPDHWQTIRDIKNAAIFEIRTEDSKKFSIYREDNRVIFQDEYDNKFFITEYQEKSIEKQLANNTEFKAEIKRIFGKE